jgi:hypothetical protein
MYQSTIFGTSVRPLAPPKAEPFQTRPVTSWNGRVRNLLSRAGHADDDAGAPALVAALQRLAHELTLPMHSNVCRRRRSVRLHQMLDEVALRLPSG